ncbi:hypothetical protein [Prochlorococcus sp. MIT 1341]|nr:hypothetical protein [Prochlorococcus sp. MIT 1341]
MLTVRSGIPAAQLARAIFRAGIASMNGQIKNIELPLRTPITLKIGI